MRDDGEVGGGGPAVFLSWISSKQRLTPCRDASQWTKSDNPHRSPFLFISPRPAKLTQQSIDRETVAFPHSSLLSRADFERISLNAMEERVLPPEIRIKIVFAQAQAVAQEEEDLLDANVSCRVPKM